MRRLWIGVLHPRHTVNAVQTGHWHMPGFALPCEPGAYIQFLLSGANFFPIPAMGERTHHPRGVVQTAAWWWRRTMAALPGSDLVWLWAQLLPLERLVPGQQYTVTLPPVPECVMTDELGLTFGVVMVREWSLPTVTAAHTNDGWVYTISAVYQCNTVYQQLAESLKTELDLAEADVRRAAVALE